MVTIRSIRSQAFYEKAGLKILEYLQKSPVLKYLFTEVTTVNPNKWCWDRCFLVKLSKPLRIYFFRNTSVRRLLFRWYVLLFNPVSANPTKWSNTFKQFVGYCRLSVFDHSVGLTLKGLNSKRTNAFSMTYCDLSRCWLKLKALKIHSK